MKGNAFWTWPESRDYRVTAEIRGEAPRSIRTFEAYQHQPGTFNYESEKETLARWDHDGEARIKVEILNPLIRIQNVRIRPRLAGIDPVTDPEKRCVSFLLDTAKEKHRILSIEIDGTRRPLFLFTEPHESRVFSPDEPGAVLVPPSESEEDVIDQERFDSLYRAGDLLYFSPGVYNMEYLTARGNDKTWYLAEGAVIRLRRPACMPSQEDRPRPRNGITLTGKNVRILGRGILDGKADTDAFPHPLTCHGNVLCAMDSENVTVEGLMITHPMGFSLVALRCRDVLFDLIRTAGCQDMTSNDGILIDGTKNAVVRRVFANNHDDSLEVKTHHFALTSTENVVFEDSVVWNRGGMCLAAAWENWWDIRDVTWRRISVIHHENYGNGALCVYTGNRGRLENLLFEDIDVEDTPFGGIAVTVEKHPWCYWGRKDIEEMLGEKLSDDPNENWSTVGDVTFRNIEISHGEDFDSDFYPKPRLPANGNGHGGRGYKLHIPMPGFSSGRTDVTRSHLEGTIVFENVYIHTYRDRQSFSRFGRAEDHDGGRPIPGHFLTDLTTDRWILWEGVNPRLWELIPGKSADNEYSPLPDEEEQEARLSFWEKRVVFRVTPGAAPRNPDR